MPIILKKKTQMKKFKIFIFTLFSYLVQFKNWVIFKYFWYKRKIQFYFAKKKADTMHAMTGRKYYVVPSGKKLQVITSDVIKVFNKRTKQKMNVHDLLKMSYYSTK